MADSIFVLFLGFSALWIALGLGAVLYLFKAQGQTVQIGKEGLIVVLSILIPFVAALVVGVSYL